MAPRPQALDEAAEAESRRSREWYRSDREHEQHRNEHEPCRDRRTRADLELDLGRRRINGDEERDRPGRGRPLTRYENDAGRRRDEEGNVKKERYRPLATGQP